MSIILPSYLQVCYTQKIISKLYFRKRRLRDAQRLTDHQRTLQLKTVNLVPGPFVILLEMDRNSRSDPGGHRKVLPFDWLTEEQKIFVYYYDYASLIRSKLQRTLNSLKNREFTTRMGTARDNTVQLYCIEGAIKYICKGFYRPSYA